VTALGIVIAALVSGAGGLALIGFFAMMHGYCRDG
jgi:hypothetical protein